MGCQSELAGPPHVRPVAYLAHSEAFRRALERAGVEFIPGDAAKGPGVKIEAPGSTASLKRKTGPIF
jgi:hypothetical protein